MLSILKECKEGRRTENLFGALGKGNAFWIFILRSLLRSHFVEWMAPLSYNVNARSLE
jgi:hypothetical protein